MVTATAPGDRDPGVGSPDDDSIGMSNRRGISPLSPWAIKGEGEG